MTLLFRRLRGLAVALAVLAISAGAVFAAAPTFVPNGAPVANEEPAPTPTTETDDGDLDEDEDEDADADADEDADTDEDGEDGDAEAGAAEAAAGTHGALVSEAAQAETPEGFANHGAYVSCVAHMKDAAEPFDLATVTPETCAAADEARAAEKAAKHEARAAAKAERAAARAEAKAGRDAAKAERAAARAAAKAARLAARG